MSNTTDEEDEQVKRVARAIADARACFCGGYEPACNTLASCARLARAALRAAEAAV